MPDTVIRSRIDPKTKREANRIFKNLGLSMSGAIRLFLRHSIAHSGLPFPVKTPNEQTRAAMEELNKGRGAKVTIRKLKREWDES